MAKINTKIISIMSLSTYLHSLQVNLYIYIYIQ